MSACQSELIMDVEVSIDPSVNLCWEYFSGEELFRSHDAHCEGISQ